MPRIPVALALVVAISACDDNTDPTAHGQDVAAHTDRGRSRATPAPAGLVTIDPFGRALTLWPFTSADAEATPSDPVNLVFEGNADPREIRAILMSLDGNRTALGLPSSPPFDCRWSDTPSGGIQATYTSATGWAGGAIQLQCGDYAPMRFHLRLFRSGDGTSVGNAHFEVLIPGTTDHQVLHWEIAEQLVTGDLMRSGLLHATAPATATAPINPAPYRTIPAIIFNGLPAELQALVRGVPGNAAADVPIPSDGRATALNVAGAAAADAPGVSRTFTLMFGQVIPKPFCANAGEYVYVSGPVTLSERASNQNGRYTTSFQADGRLEVVPIDPLTGQPTGAPYQAVVAESHSSGIADRQEWAISSLIQRLLPVGEAGHGELHAELTVDAHGRAVGHTTITCGQ